MRCEEEYEDVPRNLEPPMISLYSRHSGMTGSVVIRVLKTVLDHSVAEKRGRESRVQFKTGGKGALSGNVPFLAPIGGKVAGGRKGGCGLSQTA